MSLESSQFVPGARRLFREYAGTLQTSPPRDEYGFVEAADELFRFERLLGFGVILIVGPPWIGKSFVATQLERQAMTAGNRRVFVTRLHLHSPGEPLVPLGWDAWSGSEESAVWIIDSLDEGESIQRNIHQAILRQLRSLSSDTMQRLQVVIFCREMELPDALISELAREYGDRFIAAEMLPLTHDDARLVAADNDFARILAKIKEHSLQDAAQYPAGLKYIQRHLGDPLTTTETWKGILKELLREQDPERQKRLSGAPEIEEQFRAAAELACVMSFSGFDNIASNVADASGRRLDELLPAGRASHETHLKAARHALGSAMFAQGRRFSQKNIREWMCAFALNDLALGQLKTLLTDEHGNLNRGHLGILSLLMEIGRHDLRDWILHANRGLPLPSDLSSLTLSVARQIVDQLESLAETSPWALRLWGEDNIKHLRVAGLAQELARRIGDKARTAARRIALLQMATAISASEAVDPALAILRHGRLSHELVETALILVKKLATADQLQSMERFVRVAKPRTRIGRAAVSAIIQSYLEQGFWSIEQAVVYAPDARGEVLDSTHLLQKTMSERLTLEAARIVVQRKLPDVLDSSSSRQRVLAYPREDILYRAIALLVEQEFPSADDLTPLIPLALRQWEGETHLRFNFTPAFRKVQTSRRQLYLAELEKSRSNRDANPHRSFRWVLTPDDVEWIIEQLPNLAGSNDAVWEDAMIAAHGGPDPIIERARAFVHEHRPAIVEAFAANIAQHEALERKLVEQRRAAEQESRKREVLIADAVASVLKASDRPLKERMWDLSLACFANEHVRPSNLVGTWDDLDLVTQGEVLDVCLAAIRECESTRFSASSISGAVQFEAWCFGAVVKKRSSDLALDARLIQNWLPALLVWTSNAEAEIIDVCYRTDATASEAVIVAAIRRDMEGGTPHAVVASNLDAKYWTPTLIDQVADLLRCPDFTDAARASLLKVLAQRDEFRSVDIAREFFQPTAAPELRDAALRILLTFTPDEAWPHVEVDFAAGEHSSLFILAQMFDVSTRHRFDSWPAARLRQIASMLFTIFPPNRKRERHNGFVTPEYQCRQLRDAIAGILFYRGAKDDREELATLVEERPILQRWYQRALAEEKAKTLLAPAFLPLKVVHDALSNPDYRWVRHNTDLMSVIEEQLSEIAKDIGDDAELLYRIGNGRPQLQREGAIQAYVFRRLADRLPARVLGSDATVIELSRERQGRFLQRKDLLIEANCIDRSRASVVVEIKWSENRDMSTSLGKQLGDKYLVGEHRTHGIYLVAWTGKVLGWKKKAQTSVPADPDALRKALEKQAATYVAAHSGLAIHPFVFDIVWPARVSVPKRRKKKSSHPTKRQRKKGRHRT